MPDGTRGFTMGRGKPVHCDSKPNLEDPWLLKGCILYQLTWNYLANLKMSLFLGFNCCELVILWRLGFLVNMWSTVVVFWQHYNSKKTRKWNLSRLFVLCGWHFNVNHYVYFCNDWHLISFSFSPLVIKTITLRWFLSVTLHGISCAGWCPGFLIWRFNDNKMDICFFLQFCNIVPLLATFIAIFTAVNLSL
jgi:hypothetical protein